MRFFLRFLITAVAVYVLIEYRYLSGIVLERWNASLLIFIFILWLVNLVLGWILRLITFPIRILSLWLVGSLISIFIVKFTDKFVTGVDITEWKSVVIIALVMWIVTSLLS